MRQSVLLTSRLPNRVILLPFSLAVVSCGHGPPERLATIGDYDTPPASRVTIALRSFDVVRPARGLSAFPDGGIAIGLDYGVEVNVCEKVTGRFQQIAVIHEPPKPQPSFGTPMIVEWLDTAVRIKLYTGGDTVVRLPTGFHIGTAPKKPFTRFVLPECEESLNALRYSNRMPDGMAVTP
jgi:hypothetical protein